jgi:subtilisin family serine protease
VNQYRGNLGGGQFNHNYNWWDPSHVCPNQKPCDNIGHGTHTMGTMVGKARGAKIGVAPKAKWIEAKGCETNGCSSGALLSSGQFMLAPTDLNGQNPKPELRPDVVNNSWSTGNGGDTFYQATVTAWVSAGVFPQFANGNNGPGCGTVGAPASYVNSYGAGAYDINNNIASFSSRGPSPFGQEIKPNVSAPGVNVRSSLPGNTYGTLSGTSMASPHVAGVVALLIGKNPSLRGDITSLRAAIDDTAVDVNALQCGGSVDDNNVFGEGRIDALAAVGSVLAPGRLEVTKAG